MAKLPSTNKVVIERLVGPEKVVDTLLIKLSTDRKKSWSNTNSQTVGQQYFSKTNSNLTGYLHLRSLIKKYEYHSLLHSNECTESKLFTGPGERASERLIRLPRLVIETEKTEVLRP